VENRWIEIKRVAGKFPGICRDRGSGKKRSKGLSLFPRIVWKGPMMNPAATELVLINSLIILLIMVDGIIRIGSAK
jgi:hypothetical protein